jgi:rubrerythrin
MPHFYSIQDILSFAIRLEQASQEFYQQLSPTVHDPSVARFLLTLAQEEQLHEAKLLQLLDEHGAVLDKSISSEEIDSYVQSIEVPQQLDYESAVKLAMNKEKSAQMLYSVLAGVMGDKSLEDMFLLLSNQEEKHKQFFEKEYRRIKTGKN